MNLRKLSLRRLQTYMQERGPEAYGEIIQVLASDPREGAQRLVRLCQTRLDEWQHDRQRLVRLLGYERQIWAMGYQAVAGLAEAGRGTLAGPIVAAAVVLPMDVSLPGLEEVKRLSAKRRRDLYAQIVRVSPTLGTGMVQPEASDEASLLRATYSAMGAALAGLSEPPEYLLVDGLQLPGVRQPQTLVVGSEGMSGSVAAAALVARVIRDQHMLEMDRLYPQYGFATHKGYGTAEHRLALERYGPSPIHRKAMRSDTAS